MNVWVKKIKRRKNKRAWDAGWNVVARRRNEKR
jgi:hypothetical protein